MTEDFAAAERDAERQRAAREREQIERAGERIIRDIDQAMARPDIARGSEMGQSPPSPPQTRELEERMLDLKRQQLKRGLSVVRTPAKETEVPAAQIRYDSPERREAIQRHMESMGVDPHLRAVRELIERGQAAPPSQAVERPPNMTGRGAPQGGRDPRDRGTERGPDGQDRTR